MLLGLLGLLTALIHAHRPVGQPSLRESARLALRMGLLGAPLTAALFVLFPRFAPLWGIPSEGLGGRTGLTAEMEVGNMAKLAQDGSIAFRVKFDGDRIPPPSRLYFRGPVLSDFSGRQWRMMDAPLPPDAAERRAALRVAGQPVSYTVTLEPSGRPWLMVLDATAAPPELPERADAPPGQPRRPRMTVGLQWLAPLPVIDTLRYRAQSYLDFTYGLPERGSFGTRAYLSLPPGYDPRTRELAAQMRQQVGEGNPGALVDAALARLRTGGYVYTLEPGRYGHDTADEFWFDRKEGFCEHIASSFVILMRAAGVPARIVTGYQGGELNTVDQYWTVRQSDAHAWAEVWLPERGWTRVDPTSAVMPARLGQSARLQAPPGIVAGAIATLSPTMLARMRAVWEAVNNSWNQWVLNYTESRQLDLLRNLGLRDPNWRDLVKLMGALLILSALAGMAWAWWERSQHDPWLRLLGRARRKLAQAGVAAAPNAPPRQLAQQTAASALPADLRESLHGWLLALERLRYAPGGQAGAKSLATLAREWRRLRWPREGG